MYTETNFLDADLYITRFDTKELDTYEKAIHAFHKSYPNTLRIGEINGNYALYFTRERQDLSQFWRIYYRLNDEANGNIKRNAALKQLTDSLKSFQDYVIGIASIGGTRALIIEHDTKDNYMNVVTILSLGGITNESIPIDNKFVNYVHLFPDGKTLTDMVKEPVEFNEWCKTNHIK